MNNFSEICVSHTKDDSFFWRKQKWVNFDTMTLPYHSCRYEKRNTDEFVEKGIYKINMYSFYSIIQINSFSLQ